MKTVTMSPPLEKMEMRRMRPDSRERLFVTPLEQDEIYRQFMKETQGEGLWKRRTLPDILPSALDLSRIKNSPSPSKITPSPTKASPSPTADRASPWTPDGSRPLTRKHSTVWKRSSSKASIFALSPDRPGSSVTPRSAGLARTTRKFLFTLASVTMHSRRSSSSSNGQKDVRRESVGVGMSRLVGMTRGMRRTSTERMAIGGVNKLTSLANFVGLKHRVFVKRKEAKSKMMWRKLKLWTKIIHVLARLLKKHAASAMNDPASPFYSHAPGIDDLLANAVDKDHYMFFDPAHFKANTQRKISQEAQRILTKPPEERTPEEIHFAMIGLRDIPQLAIFPVRMQRNFAQFGEFQSYEAKRMILKQGHHAEGYYFVLYGNVVVAVKSEDTGFAKIVVELGRGEAFGELAIVSGGSRNSSVLTKTFTELLCITKPVYETIFMTEGQKTINDPDQENFLSSLPFLRGWPVQMLSSKSSEKHVRFMYIQRNGVIMRDSNCNNWLIVVKSGSVTVLKKLVRSKPTVSSRSGMFRDTSCATAFQTFINDSREYSRWMDTRSISLPPPLGLEEEEEDVDEHVEDEEEDDGEYEEDDFDAMLAEVAVEESHSNTAALTETEGEEEKEEAKEEKEEKEREQQETEGEEDANTDENKVYARMTVRPQTCIEGGHSTLAERKSTLRKAWSAKDVTAKTKPSILSKRPRLKKPKIHFDIEPKVEEIEPEITPEVKFAAAKRTLLDDLDAVYLSRANPVTEADKKPQFVHVHTLTKGDVFGLAQVVFPDQPSLCLISNGAECMLIDKNFYMENCPPELARRLKIEVSPYPSEQKLQKDLVNRINWDVYKQVVKRQVYEQCPARVTVTPLRRITRPTSL